MCRSSCDIAYTDNLEKFNADYLRYTTEVQGTCIDHDLSEEYMVKVSRHIEHSELTEATLNDRAFHKPETVEDVVSRNMEYELLHRAIAKLPETQRRRLLLYFFGELTYEQIAELEGCKYQTIQGSIYAALKTLKKILK